MEPDSAMSAVIGESSVIGKVVASTPQWQPIVRIMAVPAVVGAVADWAARQHPALRLREASSRRRVTHGALMAVLVLFGPAN